MTKLHAMSDAQSAVRLQHAWQISGAWVGATRQATRNPPVMAKKAVHREVM